MRHTTTIYYWGTENATSIIEDIHDHEHDGWHVHQIVPRPNTKLLGGTSVSVSDLFVVYAMDDS